MIETFRATATRSAREARRVAVASGIGTTIEWYDFFIYGTATAVVFAPQFFPQVSPSPEHSPPLPPSPSAFSPARSAASSWDTTAIGWGASRCSSGA